MSSGGTTRIESCLARFDADRDGAWNELMEVVYDRFRLLAAHILNEDFSALHGNTDDAYHDALLRLRTALQSENVAPRTKRELFGLAARHIQFALLDLVVPFRRENRLRGGRVSNSDEFAIEQKKVDPAQAFAEFQESVEGLEPDQREVIDLLYYWGFRQTEAAEILRVPVTTVQGRLKTAKKNLAQMQSEISEE